MWELEAADVWAVARPRNLYAKSDEALAALMARYRDSALFADWVVTEAARYVHNLRRTLLEGDVC
jgi:hypothetical protein